MDTIMQFAQLVGQPDLAEQPPPFNGELTGQMDVDYDGGDGVYGLLPPFVGGGGGAGFSTGEGDIGGFHLPIITNSGGRQNFTTMEQLQAVPGCREAFEFTQDHPEYHGTIPSNASPLVLYFAHVTGGQIVPPILAYVPAAQPAPQQVSALPTALPTHFAGALMTAVMKGPEGTDVFSGAMSAVSGFTHMLAESAGVYKTPMTYAESQMMGTVVGAPSQVAAALSLFQVLDAAYGHASPDVRAVITNATNMFGSIGGNSLANGCSWALPVTLAFRLSWPGLRK